MAFNGQTSVLWQDDLISSYIYILLFLLKIKVVIIGQDPYHQARQAHGQCPKEISYELVLDLI